MRRGIELEAELGWENSFLGFPVTDELPVAGGRGRTSDFERGVIAWTPNSGAHEVHGAILRRWLELGREDGLGFPLTDELTTPDTRGRYNHFENGLPGPFVNLRKPKFGIK